MGAAGLGHNGGSNFGANQDLVVREYVLLFSLPSRSVAEGKRRRFTIAAGIVAFLWLSFSGLNRAQEFDSVLLDKNRKPFTVFDQISDPAERKAILSLYRMRDRRRRAELAEAFLATYPQSWFLAQVHEIAAKSYIDLTDYPRALQHGKSSLRLLPENPLLLVPLANVQVEEGLLAEAKESARQAIAYLARMGRPSSVAQGTWPKLAHQLKASSYYALGRAAALEALAAAPGRKQVELWQASEGFLSRARALNPADPEIAYLMGLSSLSLGKIEAAASSFAAAHRQKGPLQSGALRELRRIYEASLENGKVSFEVFLKKLEGSSRHSSSRKASKNSPPQKPLTDYAGTKTCRMCHTDKHEAWSQTGMARMFRSYRPENIIGDFERNKEFYLGDEVRLRGDTVEVAPRRKRFLYAQMFIERSRHYFEIKHSNGQWHRYPVDYTIGSKWQQAYATRLPNGQIHVFPIQYNALEKRWVNFWKIIDLPGSPRADVHAWEKLSPLTSYQANCAICHTSQLRNVKGGGFETDNLEFREPGINCEMCHGPSARHAAALLAGEAYEKKPLEPPVDFHNISSRDYVAICAQCHMQSALRVPGSEGELNYSRQSGVFFQRAKSRPFAEFSNKARYKDGRFRETTFIVESLLRSACFKKGKVNCGHCHDPHPDDAASNINSLKFLGEPDQMCLQCHSQWKDKIELHTRHPAGSEASRCVSCHMPRIMNSLLFRAMTHRIDDIPNAEMTLRFRQEESPNACLLCHTDKDGQWLRQQLLARIESPPSP